MLVDHQSTNLTLSRLELTDLLFGQQLASQLEQVGVAVGTKAVHLEHVLGDVLLFAAEQGTQTARELLPHVSVQSHVVVLLQQSGRGKVQFADRARVELVHELVVGGFRQVQVVFGSVEKEDPTSRAQADVIQALLEESLALFGVVEETAHVEIWVVQK